MALRHTLGHILFKSLIYSSAYVVDSLAKVVADDVERLLQSPSFYPTSWCAIKKVVGMTMLQLLTQGLVGEAEALLSAAMRDMRVKLAGGDAMLLTNMGHAMGSDWAKEGHYGL